MIKWILEKSWLARLIGTYKEEPLKKFAESFRDLENRMVNNRLEEKKPTDDILVWDEKKKVYKAIPKEEKEKVISVAKELLQSPNFDNTVPLESPEIAAKAIMTNLAGEVIVKKVPKKRPTRKKTIKKENESK